MGLKEKLINEGSSFTYTANGSEETPYLETFVPQTNPLATVESTLHATSDGLPGYSLGNPNFPNASVPGLASQYLDDHTFSLPSPSIEDLNGIPPTISSHGNTLPYAQANFTQALPYIDNLPQ